MVKYATDAVATPGHGTLNFSGRQPVASATRRTDAFAKPGAGKLQVTGHQPKAMDAGETEPHA